MKTTLILHIGVSKTGSSSIQRVLSGRRPELSAQGVYFPQSPGRANHGLLAAAVVSNPKLLDTHYPSIWEGVSPAARLKRFREEFDAEMMALPANTRRVVITAEQLSDLKGGDIQRLSDMLRPYFTRIRVIVYLRRQDERAASAYSQWLRMGNMSDPGLPSGGTKENPQYDYGSLLDSWAAVFGDDAMVPRIYARDRLVNGDAIADFLSVADIKLADANDPTRNPSLSVAGQQLLLAAGRRMAAKAGDGAWHHTPAWRRLGKAVTDAMQGRGWRPTQAEAAEFLNRFAASNERARARFFPDRTTLFDPDFSGLPLAHETNVSETVLAAALDTLANKVEVDATRTAASFLAAFRLNRKLNDRAAMRTCLIRVIKLAPDMILPRLRMAEMLMEQGNLAEARNYAETALQIAPQNRAASELFVKAGGDLSQIVKPGIRQNTKPKPSRSLQAAVPCYVIADATSPDPSHRPVQDR